MTLSRVRRAQLPSLPAECVWRQRLRAQTAIAPPHSRHYCMVSTTSQHTRSPSISPRCIANFSPSILSSHRVVPVLATQVNQTRNATFRGAKKTELQIEARKWALSEMDRLGTRKQFGVTKKFQQSIQRKRLEKEYMDAHEYVHERTLYDGTRECKSMIFQYFPPDGSQPKLELPQFRRRGAGVDDIYLYQLLWKATGLVNEVTRRKKASQNINIHIEKYRRAQENEEKRNRRIDRKMIEAKEKVRLVGVQIEQARKEAALKAGEEDASKPEDEFGGYTVKKINLVGNSIRALADKNFEAVKNTGGYLRIAPMTQPAEEEASIMGIGLDQSQASTEDVGLRHIGQVAAESSDSRDLLTNKVEGSSSLSASTHEIHSKILSSSLVPQQQDRKPEIRTTFVGQKEGNVHRWLRTEDEMRFSPGGKVGAEHSAKKDHEAPGLATVSLEQDRNSINIKEPSTTEMTIKQAILSQQEKPSAAEHLVEEVEAIITNSVTATESKVPSSAGDKESLKQTQKLDSTADKSASNISNPFMDFKSYLGLENNSTGDLQANKTEPNGAIESLYEMALKISRQSKSTTQLRPWEQLLPEETTASNKASDTDKSSTLQTDSTTNLSPETTVDELQPLRAHDTAIPQSKFTSGRSYMSSRRRTLGRTPKNPRSQEQRASMSSSASVGSLRDRLKAKMRIIPEEISESQGPQQTLTTNYTEMKGRFVSRAQTLAKELPSEKDTETSETDNDAFIAELMSDIPLDGREPSAMIGVSHIKPGSIVEITQRVGLRPEFGVVMQKTKTRSSDYFFIMPGGHISDYSSNHCFYAVPDFIPESKIDEIIAVTRATGEVPSEMLQEISAKIREFSANCKKVILQNALKLQAVGRKLSHETNFQYLSLEEIARRIFKKEPTEEQKYAAHVTMLQDKEHFLPASRFHISHQTWEVLPKEYIANIAEVGRWIRNRDSCLKEFAVKAREVIDIVHRATLERTPTCELIGEPTREYKIQEITWNEQDKAILSFLKWASIEYHKNSDHMNGMYPTVLRLINRSTARGKFDHPALLGFLEEVGVFAPWDDRTTRIRNPRMASLYEDHPVAGKEDAIFSSYERGQSKFNSFKESMKDSMASLRHDWKDLNVYCIDAKEAEEIDDGVSVERIPDSSDVWLRIHVANPSAFIPMDHELTQISRERVSTLYAAQRSFPMLPPAICQDFFSVAPDRPVITFSARVNTETGEASDFDIRPGRVHNVKRVTYNQVDKLFNGESASFSDRILTNRPPTLREELIRNMEKDASREWEEQETDDLKLLLKAVSAYAKARAKEGLASGNSSSYNVSVNDGKGNAFTTSHISDHPYVRIGSPYIDVLRETRVFNPSRPDFIVISGMSLACRIAGEWLAERQIPAPFRALYRIWDNKDSEEQWREAVKYSIDEFGTVLDARLDAMYPTEGVPEISPVPKPHELLATDKYVKATSPLRRWSDMLAHYLIEHELLNNSLPVSERKPLLYELDAMAEECEFIQPRERDINVRDFTSKRYWISELIRNLYAAGHPILPKVMQVQITAVADWPKLPVGRVRGWPMENTKVRFADRESQQQIQVGDVVFASLSDEVWEFNSIRAAALSVQYIGMKTSATETREQFFKDLELRKQGEKASIWPAPLTEAELAEMEDIGKDLPDSQFVKLRERRIAARASKDQSQTADNTTVITLKAQANATDVTTKAQANAAEDLRQDEIADLDRVSNAFTNNKTDSAKALAEALAVVEKRAIEKAPTKGFGRLPPKREERIRSSVEHGMVIKIRDQPPQESDHEDFMALLQTVSDKTIKPTMPETPPTKKSNTVTVEDDFVSEVLAQIPSEKPKNNQKPEESGSENLSYIDVLPAKALASILAATRRKLVKIDSKVSDETVKRKLLRKWQKKEKKIEDALNAPRNKTPTAAIEEVAHEVEVSKDNVVEKVEVLEEITIEKVENAGTSSTSKKKTKKAPEPGSTAKKTEKDMATSLPASPAAEAETDTKSSPPKKKKKAGPPKSAPTEETTEVTSFNPETEEKKPPKAPSKAKLLSQLMLAKRKLKQAEFVKDDDAREKLRQRWEKLHEKYEANYNAFLEHRESMKVSEETDGEAKIKQAL